MSWRTEPEKRKAYQRSYYIKNRKKYLLYGKEWRKSNKEKVAAYNKEWHLSHKEARSVYNREWRKNNPIKCLVHKKVYGKKYQKQWFIKNPGKKTEYCNRYKARKKNAAVNDFTAQQWLEMKAHYGYRCVYCGKKTVALTQDHITPLSKGGNHTKANIVPACKPCNSSKHFNFAPKMIQPLLL